MKRGKLVFSTKLILFSIVIILGVVPMALMQTVVMKSVRENILQNTTYLTRGILEQSHLYLNRLFIDLDHRMNMVVSDPNFLQLIESIPEENYGHFFDQFNGELDRIIGNMTVYPLDREKNSLFFDMKNQSISIINKTEVTSFLRSEPAALLRENNSRRLWLGKPPAGLLSGEHSMWLYRLIKNDKQTYIIAASIEKEELMNMLGTFSSTSGAEAILISTDNQVFPESIDFFKYNFASEALSRSIEGRFNVIYDTQNDDKLMIQTYTDPHYFYNLVIVTPRNTLFRGLDSIIATTTSALVFLSLCSLILGLGFIHLINRQMHQFIRTIRDIGAGHYEIGSNSERLQLKESKILKDAIKVLAEDVRSNREMLEHRVRERTDELETSLEELHMTRQSLIHSEQMAIMGRQGAKIAHEINNPLSVSVTASSHLGTTTRDIRKKFDAGKLTKSDFAYLLQVAEEISEIIQRNLRQATGMIMGFKDFAADQSKVERRKIRIGNYVNEIIKGFSYKLRKTHFRIEFECDPDLEVITIPSIIYQTVTNLINNSLLHGFENLDKGVISIQISRKDDLIEMLYSDDGNGISPENLKQLYKPFFTTKAGQGGTGLGLNIIKDLIEGELKGTISCESSLGKGVTFVISFPVPEEEI